MKRILAVVAACVVAGSAPAEAPEVGQSPERGGVHLGFFGHSPYTARWVSNWPTSQMPLKTAKIEAGVRAPYLSYSGTPSNIFGSVPVFNFEPHNPLRLLGAEAMWVGGIRAGDTLVSTGRSGYYEANEFFSTEAPYTGVVLLPEVLGPGTGCRVEVADTFTREDFPRYWPWDTDPFHGDHVPLGISILKREYTWDHNVFGNILLLDYTVTNVAGEPIEDVFLSVVLDPEISPYPFGSGASPDWRDDQIGAFRDQSLVVAWDGDGDAFNRHFAPDTSSIHGFGFRPVLSYPVPAETTFNWHNIYDWYGSYLDPPIPVHFAPRQRGTAEEPFRPFYIAPYHNHDGFANPGCDRDRYYQMSQPEWDYDLTDMSRIGDTNPIWLPPQQLWLDSLRYGGSIRSHLAMGPFDLAPDSAFRIVYAMFGADAVLTDPTTGSFLCDGDIDEYRRRLNLQVFRDRGEDAKVMAQHLLSPQFSPTGLEVSLFDADSVTLNWDARVFPDISGYRVRLSPIPASAFVAPGQVCPSATPLDGSVTYTAAPEQTSLTIRNLTPGKYYFAQIAHEYDGRYGQYSYPVVVGYGNAALTPDFPKPQRDFAFVCPGDTGAILQWDHPDDGLTAYYKIYRRTDSAAAANRHRPFFAVDTALTSLQPLTGGRAGDLPWFYYEMKAYDSVPVGQTAYCDRNVQPEAWYWVSAVSRHGYESEFSPLIRLHPSLQPDRDVLVILGSTTSFHDFVIRDSLYAYYHRLLDGRDYDLYDWADTNGNVHADHITYRVNWEDLARYRLVIVEDLPSTAILTTAAEARYKTLQRLIASGRDVLYFGVPGGGRYPFSLSTTASLVRCPDTSAEVRCFGVDSVALRPWKGVYNVLGTVDSLAGFAGAEPAAEGLPPLSVDLTSCRLTSALTRLFAPGPCLPMTPAFYPSEEAEVIYRFQSAYPETSELDGLPCGVRMRHPGANAYAFSFHLWGMDESDARALVDFALDHQEPDTAFTPPPLSLTFRLYQNYPNPFNPSTTISYDLFQSGHVRLEVFNILGQTVATLVDADLPAGVYEAIWNGCDERGRPAASGVYLYRLETAGSSRTRKMLLVK